MSTLTTSRGAVVDDHRAAEDKAQTAFFVVGNDTFMSGWGKAPGTSFFAVPCKDWAQAQIVLANMKRRGDMKRARIVKAHGYRPRLFKGDHLSIRAMSDCARFYAPNGFLEET